MRYSLAAAALFRQNPVKAWNSALQYVLEAKQEHGLTSGESGEEVGRTCLTSATDFVSRKKSLLERTAPIRLSEFLKELFFETPEERAKAAQLLRHTKDYWMNFTHYARSHRLFHDATKMPIATVVEAYTRQAAIVGQPKQECWDTLLPVLWSEDCPVGNQAFDPADISYVSVLFHNQGAGETEGARSNLAVSSVDMPSATHKVLVTIWFDLCGKSAPCHIYPSPVFDKSGANPPDIQYFHLTASGHTQETLKVLRHLNGEAQETIRTLLGAEPLQEAVQPIVALKENHGEVHWLSC
jgi:hypothetical protein